MAAAYGLEGQEVYGVALGGFSAGMSPAKVKFAIAAGNSAVSATTSSPARVNGPNVYTRPACCCSGPFVVEETSRATKTQRLTSSACTKPIAARRFHPTSEAPEMFPVPLFIYVCDVCTDVCDAQHRAFSPPFWYTLPHPAVQLVVCSAVMPDASPLPSP